jgi:hypothetical protein
MKTYAAQIKENVVTEIIVGDYEWANENLEGEWVDCTEDNELIAGVGYNYDAKTNQFIAPEVETN